MKLLGFVLGLLPVLVFADTVQIAGSNGVPLPINATVSANGLPVYIANRLAGEGTSFAQSESVFNTMDGPWEMEEIAASATDQSMGTAGSTGDFLAYCMVTVVTAATATFGIEDGSNTAFDNITVIVGGAALVAGAPIYVPVFAQATTAAGWEITTGAGATAYCGGRWDTAGD